MSACGQKLVKFCAHTHAAKLVVRIMHNIAQSLAINETNKAEITLAIILSIRQCCTLIIKFPLHKILYE